VGVAQRFKMAEIKRDGKGFHEHVAGHVASDNGRTTVPIAAGIAKGAQTWR